MVEQKILKLETQVKGLPEVGTNPALATAVQRREDQGIKAGDPPAYVNNTPSLYPDLGAMGLMATASAFPVREVTPAVPGAGGAAGQPAQSVYHPFKESELRSMRERVLELKGSSGVTKELITQWVGTHRCTHRDIGILCHAVLSASVWRTARQGCCMARGRATME